MPGATPATEVSATHHRPGPIVPDRTAGNGVAAWPPVAATVRPGNHRTIVGPQRTPAHVTTADPPADPAATPDRARGPVPPERDREAPAPVVVRHPAPRLVGNPRPPVGGPDPPAVRVGAPAGGHTGLPHIAHRLLVGPGPVVVELRSVRLELLRKVAPAVGRPGLPRLEVAIPLAEVVLCVPVERCGFGRPISPAGPRSLTRGQADVVAAGVERGLTLVDGELRFASVDVDADDARTHGLDQAARGLDLEDGRLRGPGPEDEAARPQTQDDALVTALVVVGVVELAAPVEAHHGSLGELERHTSRGIRPHPVAGEEGKVRDRLLRGGLGGPLQGDTGLHVSDVPVSVLLLRCGGSGAKPAHSKGETRQNECALPHGRSTSGSPHGSRRASEQGPCRITVSRNTRRINVLREIAPAGVSWGECATVLSGSRRPRA